MARANDGSHNFSCHPHVYSQVDWIILTFNAPASEHRRTFGWYLLLISRPTEGRWLSWHRVCIVSSDGHRIIHSHGEHWDSDTDQYNVPVHLVVDDNPAPDITVHSSSGGVATKHGHVIIFLGFWGMIIIGSKSLYCIYFGGSWRCFSVITSPNRNLCGWNVDYKWGAMVCTRTRKMGKSPQGFCPRMPKCVFCYQCNVAFRPLILHRFRPFLKQQTWIAFRMHTSPVKNFRISAPEVLYV